MTSPYQLLKINTSATDEQIKKAFRKLSVQYHPDRIDNDDPEREAKIVKFTKITEAKETLLDPKLRHAYDRGGWELVKHTKEAQHIMEQRRRKCEPIIVHKEVRLDQLYHKQEIRIEVPVPIHNEDGTIVDTVFPMEFKLDTLGKIVAQNMGVQKPDHIPGDIIVITELDQNCPFMIKRLDLIYTAKLNILDLVLGYKVTIPHPKEPYFLSGNYSFTNDDDDNLLIFPGMGLTVDDEHIKGDMIVHLIPEMESLKGLDNDTVTKLCDLLIPILGEQPNGQGLKDISSNAKTPAQMRAGVPGIEQMILGGLLPGTIGSARGSSMDNSDAPNECVTQ